MEQNTKFCAHCGQQIHRDAVVCVHCGCSVAPQQAPVQQAVPANAGTGVANANKGLLAVSFLIPLVGIILFFVNMSTDMPTAKKYLFTGLGGWLFWFGISLFMMGIGGFF